MTVKALQMVTDSKTGVTHLAGEVFDMEPKDRVAAAVRKGIVEMIDKMPKQEPAEAPEPAEPETAEPEAAPEPKKAPAKKAAKPTKKVSRK